MSEKKCLEILLLLYSFCSCLVGLIYIGVESITIRFIIPFILMLSTKKLFCIWFDMISFHYNSIANYRFDQTIYTVLLGIVCLLYKGRFLPILSICFIRWLTMETVSYRLFICQNTGPRCERRFVLMVPFVFCIMEPMATGTALAFALQDNYGGILTEGLVAVYALIWEKTIDKKTEAVINYNKFYFILISVLIAFYHLLFFINPYLGRWRKPAAPYMSAISFVYIVSLASAIPGMLEIIQILWRRKDLGREKLPDNEAYYYYCRQLDAVRIVDMFCFPVVTISWVYWGYSIYYFLLYILMSTTYVVLSRHHYVRINKRDEYHGNPLWGMLWTIIPTGLFLAEHYKIMPTELNKIYEWPSYILAGIVEVLCVFLGYSRIKSVSDIRTEIDNLGLLSTHIIGIAMTSFILIFCPEEEIRKGFALLAMIVSIIIIAIAFFINYNDPLPKRKTIILEEKAKRQEDTRERIRSEPKR